MEANGKMGDRGEKDKQRKERGRRREGRREGKRDGGREEGEIGQKGKGKTYQ